MNGTKFAYLSKLSSFEVSRESEGGCGAGGGGGCLETN